MLIRKRCACVIAMIALFEGLLGSAKVHAQTASSQKAVAAQALYDQATSEMDKENFVSACRKLEEVTRLAPDGLGGKLTLGQCYEHLGRLASAWLQYTQVEAMAARMGQSERMRKAAEKAAALKPKLATLTVQVPDGVRAIEGLSIMRDDVPLGEAQWNAPMPVDVGEHQVVVTAPGRTPRTESVEVVADGAKVSVVVKLGGVDLTVEKERDRKDARVVQAPVPKRLWQAPVGIVTAGLGLAGVGVGAVLGGMSIAKKNESNQGHCNAQNRCDDEGLALRKQALGLGNASTGAMIAGGVLLAGGVTLFLTAPSAEQPGPTGSRESAARARVVAVPGGLLVDGRF